MKTILAASALTLIANLALAHDYQQGNFASRDLTSGYGSPAVSDFAPIFKSNLPVSLYEYYAGNPDVVQGHPSDGSGFIARSGAPTSLDWWYAGNPDVIGSSATDGRSLIRTQRAIARQTDDRDGGV